MGEQFLAGGMNEIVKRRAKIDKLRAEAEAEELGEPEEKKIEEGGKFEILSKELADKGIKENDLVRVRLSEKHHKGGPDGLYGTDTRGYFVDLTDAHLIIKGYHLKGREIIEEINIEDVEGIDKK